MDIHPLGRLSPTDAAQVNGRHVPRLLNLRNPMGYPKRIVLLLIKQRRKYDNVISAYKHRNNAKKTIAGYQTTIAALQAEIRELKANQEVCQTCIITESKMRTIANVYDCSPFVLYPAMLS